MDMLVIRQMLEQILGYNYPTYLKKLRQWFANMITKERFDDEMRPMLQGEALKLHNQLLLGILIQSNSLVYNQSSSDISADFYGQQNSQMINQQQENQLLDESLEQDDEENEDDIISDDELDPAFPFEICLQISSLENNRGPTKKTQLKRFPSSFSAPFQAIHNEDFGKGQIIPNVTHNLLVVEQNVKGSQALQKVFRLKHETEPVLTSEASLLGRFLVQAWKNNVDNVHPKAMNIVRKACINHIKTIIIAIVKQRKAFRLQNGRVCHSFGAPYPNPYLLQGHHLFGDTYSSDTAKLADVMQIPSFLPTQEEKERLAALEVAASVQLRYSHLKTKATLTDLLDAIQSDKSLIPNYSSRLKICEEIFQKAKGYGDTYSSYKDGKDLVAKTVYPIITY